MAGIGFGPSLGIHQRRSAAGFDFTGPLLPRGAVLTRASVGVRVDAGGTLGTVAADVARFDCDPIAHAVRGVLVEAGATNLVSGSERLSEAGWSMSNGTVASDAATAPNGTVTAERLTVTGTSYALVFRPVPLTTRETISVFVKAGTAPFAYLYQDTSAGFRATWFDTATGAIGTNDLAGVLLDRLPNGWFRVAVTAESTTGNIGMGLASSAGAPAVTAGSTGYFWGAQVEAGSVATSYVPSGDATATRAADVLTLDWASRGVADGARTLRYTFDDGSSQTVTTSVSGGVATVPTTLARARLIRASLA